MFELPGLGVLEVVETSYVKIGPGEWRYLPIPRTVVRFRPGEKVKGRVRDRRAAAGSDPMNNPANPPGDIPYHNHVGTRALDHDARPRR